MPKIEYDKQREKVTPPHIPLGAMRAALHLTQIEVCRRVEAVLNRKFTQGALSAIESGTRGASVETLAALEIALGLGPGSLVTDFQPLRTKRKHAAIDEDAA